jgi:hypothetical protein
VAGPTQAELNAKQGELNAKILEDITIVKERLEIQRNATLPLADLITKVAVLEDRVAEMQKAKDQWGQRGWAVFIVLLSTFASFLSGIVGALLISQFKK